MAEKVAKREADLQGDREGLVDIANGLEMREKELDLERKQIDRLLEETNDQLELGTFNPHLFGMTAVHPASPRAPGRLRMAARRTAGRRPVAAAGRAPRPIHLIICPSSEGHERENLLIRQHPARRRADPRR